MKRLAILAVVALSAGVLVGVGISERSATEAAAQSRTDCSDGPGNARDQIAGTLLDEFLPDGWNPFSPEAPDEVWDRCIEPYFRPSPVGYNPGGTGPGTNSGDPHILTQDGVRFDFHAAGDFVLLSSPQNDVEMQVRYRRAFDSVSLFDGIAVRIGDSTLAIEVQGSRRLSVVTLNGEVLELAEYGWHDLDQGVLVQTGDRVFVRFDNGLTLQAHREGLSLLTPPDWSGEFEGIQGNGDGDPTNDIVTRDGTAVDPADSDEMYSTYFDSWWVDPADSFFPTRFDEATDGPILPPEILTLSDLPPDDVNAAALVCEASGLVAGSGLEECVFDVAVTGDETWAIDVPVASKVRALPAVGLDPTVEDQIELPEDGTIGVDTPVPGAGHIETRYYADEYTVPGSSDDRVLRATTPCADAGGAVGLIVFDSTPSESLPLACGQVHPLPRVAFVLRVIDPYGGTPSYGFTIGAPDRIELGDIEFGRTYRGERDIGEVVVGTLETPPGTAVFVDPGRASACSVSLVVRDSLGAPQGRPVAGCLGGEAVALTGVAPFSLEISGSVASAYTFTVTEVEADSVTAADLGEITLEVTSPGQSASAEIELATGQRIYIETVADIAGNLRVTAPDDEVVASSFSFADLGLIVAPEAGTYTVTIDPEDDTIGEQRLFAHTVADDTSVEVRPDETIRLAITTPGQLASAAIDLDPGDRIYVETIADVDGEIVLAGPDGEELGSAFSFHDLGLFEADAAGAYTVTIAATDATIGVQELVFHAVADDSQVDARLGTEVTLRIVDPGQRASAVIDLAAGDDISIEIVKSINGRVRVIDPGGTQIASGFSFQDIGSLRVPATGTYRIEVSGTDAETGSEVLIVRTAGP